MSSEWPAIPLDELTDGTNITYGVVKPGDECPNGVKFVRGGDVIAGRILTSQLRTITTDVSQQYARTLLHGGELLVSLVGNPGEVALVPASLKGANIARQVGLVRIDPAKADANYVQYYLRSKTGRDVLLAHSKGSVQQVINLKDLKSVKVPLPPISVQRSVAVFIQALDDRITLLRETNATLEAIAQALFKSWFVDFDPVRAKMEGRTPEGMDEATAALFPDGFETSELGDVPKGWRATDLADLTSQSGGSIQTGPFGSQLHASDYVEVGIPVVMPKDISLRRVQTDSIARVSPSVADRLARHKLAPGDVVFSRRGDVERHALISETERGWLCGTGCLLVNGYAELLQIAKLMSSSMSTLAEPDAELPDATDVRVEQALPAKQFATRVRDLVLTRNSNLAGYFNKEAYLLGKRRATRFGFLSDGLAAHFGLLQPTNVRNYARMARGLIAELSIAHRASGRAALLVLGFPSLESPTLTDKERSAIEDYREQLGLEAHEFDVSFASADNDADACTALLSAL